jgi:hypothetical protein
MRRGLMESRRMIPIWYPQGRMNLRTNKLISADIDTELWLDQNFVHQPSSAIACATSAGLWPSH